VGTESQVLKGVAVEVRFFQVGQLRADVTHLWKTHPMVSGSRRFGYVYRLCRLVEVVGDHAKIRLTGLKSRPVRLVPVSEVIDLPSKAEVKTLPISA